MNSFEIMIDEHNRIKEMLEVIKAYCLRILRGEEVDYEDFFLIIDFIRNYADKHHHGKEEELLFVKMINELGAPGEKLVKYGMLVEHVLGRLFVKDLEEGVKRVLKGDEEAKLEVIANGMGYRNLLLRHIEKEDTVVYKFAENNLSLDTLEALQKECDIYEIEREESVHKYLKLIKELKNKVL